MQVASRWRDLEIIVIGHLEPGAIGQRHVGARIERLDGGAPEDAWLHHQDGALRLGGRILRGLGQHEAAGRWRVAQHTVIERRQSNGVAGGRVRIRRRGGGGGARREIWHRRGQAHWRLRLLAQVLDQALEYRISERHILIGRPESRLSRLGCGRGRQ